MQPRVEVARHSALIAGLKTGWLQHGSGDPLVALHGIPTSARLFEPLLPHLPGFHVIAPDLIGQGDTETPRTGRIDFSAYLAHLTAFLDEVAPREFHLLLHDLGGVLGLTWALDHLPRVRSVVLLSSTVTPGWRIRAIYLTNLVLGRRMLRFALPRTLHEARAVDAALLDQWAAPWTRHRLIRGSDHFSAAHARELRVRLHQLECPTLLIWGRDDNVFPLRHAEAILRELPRGGLMTIAQCGHWSPWDQPEQVAALVHRHCTAFP